MMTPRRGVGSSTLLAAISMNVHPERVADPEERGHGGRLEVAFELADVGARQTGPEGELFRCQSGINSAILTPNAWARLSIFSSEMFR